MRPGGKVTLHKAGQPRRSPLAFVMTANQAATAYSLETADATPAFVTISFPKQ
jgi:hypothetical protein